MQSLNLCRKCGGKAADWWNRGIYDITGEEMTETQESEGKE